MSTKRTRERRTWADVQGIPTGVWEEIYDDHQGGITITERNRATVFAFRRQGIEELQQYLHNNYRRKGIRAVLFGIDDGTEIKYAVFVQDGFLREVISNEEA